MILKIIKQNKSIQNFIVELNDGIKTIKKEINK